MTNQILSPYFLQYGIQFEEIVKLMNVCIIHEKRELYNLVQKNKTIKIFKLQEQIDIRKRDYLTLIINRKVAQGMIELCETLYYETQKHESIDWKKISKYLSKSIITKNDKSDS